MNDYVLMKIMVHGGKGLHHLQKNTYLSKATPFKKFMDKLVLVAAVIGPFMTLPQLYKIWFLKLAAGVSALSWSGYLIYAIIWFIYGIIHKEKPIIITYTIWIILEIFVILGTLIYG